MEFGLSEEQALIQETARRFTDSELAPVASLIEEPSGRDTYLKNLKGLADLGFMGLNIDTTFGGSEAGVIPFSLAITEVAKACASTAVAMSVNNLVGEVVQSIGTDEQKNIIFQSFAAASSPALHSVCLKQSRDQTRQD